MENEYPHDGYFGSCAVCGAAQIFVRTARAIRESYRCSQCTALLREREQAAAILDCYPGTGAPSLARLTDKATFRRLRIYEPGTTGPFRKLLRGLPFYQQSDFYPPEQRDCAPPEIPHQSLEALGFEDASFDLVITSDILEHVRRPQRAFEEIARVLKPGGFHVFTVPLQCPLAPDSTARVDTSGDADLPLKPAHYHGNGKGGKSLVYTDFGADIVAMTERAGFATRLRRAATDSRIVNNVVTLVSKRI